MPRKRPKPSQAAEKAKKTAPKSNPRGRPKKSGEAQRGVRGRQWQPSARDLEIYTTYCHRGSTQRQLGKQYGLSLSQISKICQETEKYLASKFIMEIRSLRLRSTKRLEYLYNQAIEGYERSCQDAVTITEKKTTEGIERTVQTKGQAGSPAFLNQAREAVNDLLEIWGAKAPKEIRHEFVDAQRVGGRTPEEALKERIAYLNRMMEPSES